MRNRRQSRKRGSTTRASAFTGRPWWCAWNPPRVGCPNTRNQALRGSCADQDIGKEVFLTEAATPTAASKSRYWEQYLRLETPPEQWTQDSLSYFHWPGQEELTFPFLREALEQVDWVKQNRRIFFMPAWLDAFVNGHSSPAALAVVDGFLAESQLSQDVRKKLLQSRDGLARAVRIREAFAK